MIKITDIYLKPNWFLIVIILLITFVILLYFLYFYKKSNDFASTWLYLKILTVIIIMILICLLFYYEVIQIWIKQGSSKDKSENWLFTIFNALILGSFLNLIGISFGSKYKFSYYLVFFVLVYLAISGLGYLGILIRLNFDFLLYKDVQTNSSNLAKFIIFNIILFTLIVFIAVLAYQESKD